MGSLMGCWKWRGGGGKVKQRWKYGRGVESRKVEGVMEKMVR